jgi:hypothetical protein
MYRKKYKAAYNRETCTPMSLSALVKISKLWHHHRCPSTDELIQDVVYIYSGNYSAIKRDEISLCRKLNGLKIFTLSKLCQNEKDTSISFSYTENLAHEK